MNILRKLSLASILLGIMSAPAFAGVIVYSPANGADVAPSFNLSSFANWCGNQNIVKIGYSVDNSTYSYIVDGQNLNVQVSPGSGWHTIHAKAWGQYGGVCVTDASVNVTASAAQADAGANAVGAIQSLSSWAFEHDGGTPGWSSGAMSVTNSPSLSGFARELYTVYGNSGGERYHTAFADDVSAHNFLYDVWIYLTDSAANIANLEFDLNQVMPNGQTALFGVQCDGYSGTWDYNANWTGPANPSNTWMHSSAPCNIRSWGRNQWHHLQFSYSRDDYGVITYHAAYVDGLQQSINATAPSAYALGWAPVILTNVQVDGLGGSGSVTLFVDNLVVSRW